MPLLHFFAIILIKIKDIFIGTIIFLLNICLNFIELIFNFFFLILIFLGIFFLNALNSSIYCAFFIFVYLYLISPLIYLTLFFAGFFSKLLPFLFIYFLMCYNTIYIPGYKAFYFFGHALWYWKWYWAYYVKIYLLKFHYIYYFNFFFLFLYCYDAFYEFNIISFIGLFYVYHVVYYYIFLFFKFVGNICSLIVLLIINFLYLNNLMIINKYDEMELTAADTVWEMFNYRLNYRFSAYDYVDTKRYYRVNKHLINYMDKRDLELEGKVINDFNDLLQIKNSRLWFYNWDKYKSYWVRHQKIYDNILLSRNQDLDFLKDSLKTMEELKEEYGHMEEFQNLLEGVILDTEYLYDGDFDLDLESKIKNMDFDFDSFILYRNLLQKDMGMDLFYLPTTKERDSLSYLVKNPIYRYYIQDNIINQKIEDDYIEAERDNLRNEYLSEKNLKKGNFNFFSSFMDYIGISNKNENKYINLYLNKNNKEYMDEFFMHYLNNKKNYNNGDFYAHNEHNIYETLKNYTILDADIEDEIDIEDFERDLSKRENWNLERLYKTIKITTLYNTNRIPFEYLEFNEFSQPTNIFYSKDGPGAEKLKLINSKWMEDLKYTDVLSLESSRLKYNPLRSRHLYRHYENSPFKYSIYDIKALAKHDYYDRYFFNN